MARFWKRSEDRIERLLRSSRRTPTEDFASSILDRISVSQHVPRRRLGSPRRLGLALALSIASLALIAALGGVTAASAGLGGIFHVASTTHTTSTINTKDSDDKGTKGTKGDDPDGDADDQKGDDEHDGDHHQYKVGICHRSEHGTKFKLIFVAPQAVPAHLAHGDHLPVNGKC
jgi:hypothetical protein